MQYNSYRPSERRYYDESMSYQAETPLPVPKQYVCNRCKQGGHHVMQCPTNEDPRFDAIPNPTYVCMFCEKRGDHYRMFCPNNPVENSIYMRRLAKGLIEDTGSITSNLSSFALRSSPSGTRKGMKNSNFVPLGTNNHKKRFRSDSSSVFEYKTPGRLLKEEDEDYLMFERSSSPSPEDSDARRSHKRKRVEDNYTVQNTCNQQEEGNNVLTTPIIDNSRCHLLTQLFNDPGKVEANMSPVRVAALDMWEVNDIRKLRQERYGDDQTIVPFEEDVYRYLQVKEAYEQGGQAWERALEDLIDDAYRSLTVSDEASAQAVHESSMHEPSLPRVSPFSDTDMKDSQW